jgi:hypothetical protein
MSLIQTPEELANAIRNDPQRVAECLHRINRFGGQAIDCSVLQHSLAVYYRSIAQPLSVRLWALLHDCHEILTGDVVRPYANSLLASHQTEIDYQLRKALGLTLSIDRASDMQDITAAIVNGLAVRQADIAAGTYELQRATAGRRVYSMLEPVSDWVDSVRALLSEVNR